MIYSGILLATFLPALTRAANDWTKPCLQGICSYDLPLSSGASGTLRISGSPNAISDITTAAGWMILSCDKNVLMQDIRLVCQGEDTVTAGCDHLHRNTGAINKLVRLPENCGKSAFARVANAWISEDQSIPPSIATKLVRRDGSQPQVHALTLDTNFSAIDPSQSGMVSLTIQGANIPGFSGNGTITSPPPQRRSRLAHRGITDFIKNTLNNFKSFNFNKSSTLPSVNVQQDFPILNQAISCGPVGASIKADINTKAHAVVDIGIAASGSIAPPSLDHFGLYVGLTADLDGTLNIAGSATGTLDSGKLALFEVGIPGLDFPGILTVGPSFKIDAQAIATLDVDVDLTVDLAYHIKNASLVFPPSGGGSGGSFTPGDTPLKLSVSPSAKSTGTISAHLIPTLDLGLAALGDVASASIFLELDTSATLQLTLDTQAQANATFDPAINSAVTSSNAPNSTDPNNQVVDTSGLNPNYGSTNIPNDAGSGVTKRANTSAGASIQGCVDVGSALDVNAGAEGSFFDIFDAQTKVNLFSKNFNLFHKCFGATGTNAAKRMVPRTNTRHVASLRRGLNCSPSGVGSAVSVINQLISGASL